LSEETIKDLEECLRDQGTKGFAMLPIVAAEGNHGILNRSLSQAMLQTSGLLSSIVRDYLEMQRVNGPIKKKGK